MAVGPDRSTAGRLVPSLDSLLCALHDAGLHVGAIEVLRLREVFARAPERADGGSRLKSLLSAVLVKRPEDRAVLDRVYDAWLGQAEMLLQEAVALEPPPSPIPPLPFKPPRRRARLFGLAAIVLLAGALIAVRYWPRPPDHPPSAKGPETTQAPTGGAARALTLDELRKRTVSVQVPKLTVTPPESHWTGWPALALGASALLAAAGLWFALRRRSWFPEPAPRPSQKGPPRVLLSSEAPPYVLLDREQQEALAWGIGRFVTEEPTKRLDIPSTVRATARNGGIPELHFERARYYREVWLWLDDATDDPDVARLADEVEHVLAAHGLATERAWFRDLPDTLRTPSGQVFGPKELEERRDLALVAIFTDGRGLVRQHVAEDRRVAVEALLRVLSNWPQLWFVDFSRGASGLGAVLSRFGLERILPQDLAARLGGGPPVRRVQVHGYGEEAFWAAACALVPAPVDEATALRLRQHLGLAPSLWGLGGLRAQGSGPPGRLQWTGVQRARLVNWLSAAEVQSGPKASMRDKALGFWERFYAEEDRRRSVPTTGPPWQDSPARRHLQMEQALLALWRKPARAIRELYRLFQGGLAEPIRKQLADLAAQAAADHGPERMRLPWAWADRSGPEQFMLLAMGFGGAGAAPGLRRPGRLWLGIGISAGLALGAWAIAAFQPRVTAGGEPQVSLGNAPPDAHAWSRGRTPTWTVAVATHKEVAIEPRVPEGAIVTTAWQPQVKPCIESTGAGELWRCPSVSDVRRLPQDIFRSLVYLVAKPGDPGAAELARALLDSGSADLVWVSPDDPNQPKNWDPLLGKDAQAGRGMQLVALDLGASPDRSKVLTPEAMLARAGQDLLWAWVDLVAWSDLTAALRIDDVRPVAQVAPKTARVVGHGDKVLLRGLGPAGCRPQDAGTGMAFVRLCPGSFQMGSPEGEKDRYPDEGPVHTVTVPGFDIGKDEVTNAQYQRFQAKHSSSKGEENYPVTSVSWNEARAFCEHYGYRLPSEAEWEYAARAGTATRWSFGDDEAKLGDYAWYSANSGGKAHAVGTREPNPWGLYDMHGNAWEWVQDCWHVNYQGASADGSAWEGKDCSSRVLRGGAFFNEPRHLRSALRNGIEPAGRSRGIGFRCARAAPRQP